MSEADPASPPRPRTGTVDGDTLRIEDETVRVFGIDSPERDQWGYDREGRVPIGEWATTETAGRMTPDAQMGETQGQSYGRTVAPVTNGDADLGQDLLREGWTYAEPNFLASDPDRRFDYMQAERLARMNRLGVHDYYVQPPAEFRDKPDYTPQRETVAQFFDTPTPFAGLSGEAEQGYLDVSRTGSPGEILAYAEAHGFKVDPAQVADFVRARDGGATVDYRVDYLRPPEALTDLGDSRFAQGARSYSQGFVAGGLDELGAFADMFGGTENRENIFNSDRRWADIWANNQQQNRSILRFDQFEHPGQATAAELAGAVTSGFVIPYGSGAKTLPQLARVGGEYGLATALLSNEGSVAERLTTPSLFGLPSMIVDPAIGALGNVALGKAIEVAGPSIARGFRETNAPGASTAARAAGYAEPEVPRVEAPPVADDVAPPPEGFVVDEPVAAPVAPAAAPEPVAAPVGEGAGGSVFEQSSAELRNGDAVGFETRGGRLEVRQVGADEFEIDRGLTVQRFDGATTRGIAENEGWTRSARTKKEARDAARAKGRVRFGRLEDAKAKAAESGVPEDDRQAWADAYLLGQDGDEMPVSWRTEAGDIQRAGYEAGASERVPAPAEVGGESVVPPAESPPAAAEPRRPANIHRDDLIKFVARNGGLSRDGLSPAYRERFLNEHGREPPGHDLTNTGHLNKFVPGGGMMLREKGRGLEEMAELVWEAGYFGPPDITPRPTERELIDTLDRAMRTGEKIHAEGGGAYAPRVPTRDGEMLDPQGRTEAEAVADATASGDYWRRYDRLSDAAQARYGSTLLTDDVAELEAFMREGTDLLPSREPTPDLTDDELAPYIGAWFNRKIDEALDDSHLEADDAFYDARAFEAGPARGGGEGRAPEPGNPRQGETLAGDGGTARPGDGSEPPLDGEGKASQPESLFEEPQQPQRTMTQQQRAELEARQQQGMARRGGQEGLGDQEGGLFSSERDQGSLLSRPEGPATIEQAFDLPTLTARLEKAVGKTTALRIVDSLGGPAGMFTHVKGPTKSYGRLVEIARDAGQDPVYTLDHEIVHDLRDLTAFTKGDWNIVAARARKEADLMASVAKRYPKLGAEGQLEEAVADLFARWQRGDYKPTSRVAAAFERIKEIFEAIRNAWRGDGFRTVRGVMDDAAEGRLAAQADDQAAKIVSKASIPEGDDYRPGVQWRVGDDSAAATEARTLTEAMGTGPTWQDKTGAAFDRFRTAMQDRHLPLLRTQQAIERMTGQPIPDEINAYMAEELMSGRIGAQLEKLNEDMVRPLFDDMAERGVTTGELEAFLRARHAPERNARMAEINPRFADGGGSGMTDAEAATILEEFRAAGKTDALTALATRVDQIRDYALDYRLEHGLISKDQADQWRQMYPNYVPLRGFKGDGDINPARPNQSGGINVRGKESQRAFGRESESDSPLAYTMLQAEEAITRAETNRVAQRMIALAEANPDEAFWKINKVTMRQRVNEETGLVEDYATNQLLAEDKDWTISAKVDGKEVRLTLNRDNPAAKQMAQSLRRLTEHQLDLVTHHLGKLNRFLSAVNTQWNPEFIISNAFRDIQTATINLAGVDVKGLEMGTLADYPNALVAATKGSFRKGGGEWRKWYDDFIEDGGRVYFNRIEDVAEIRKRIQKSFRLARAGVEGGKAVDHVQRGFIAVKELVENLNGGVENAVRLAAYKNARQRGVSRDQAASLAKNLTVNFNRRGTFGPAMNAAYLFYNASVQGSVRMLMATRSPKVRKVLAAIAAAGAANEMLNSMTSAVDADGERFYDKIPAYEKSSNLIFMLPGGKTYLKIPAPWGYNTVWEAGRTPVEIWRRGGHGWQESAGNFLTTLVDSFNPVGGTESLLSFVSPTIVDPFVDIQQNRNFAGSPIMPTENPFEPPVPDHRRFFDSAAPQWQALSGFLNEASGGNAVEPGMVSVSPETLEHLFDFAIGGAGRFAEHTFDLAAKGANGEDIAIGDVPFARRVIGEKPEWLDKSTFHDRLREVETAMEYRDEFTDRGLEEEAGAYAEREAATLSLEQDAKDARRELRAIRKDRRELEGALEAGEIDRAAFKTGMEAIDAREQALVLQFNTRWNEALRAAGPQPPRSPDDRGGIEVRSGEDEWPGEVVESGSGGAQLASLEQWPGEAVEQVDIPGELEAAIPGVRFTSGFRTPEYQADMRRRGYKPATNSAHLDGSALDMLPPEGKSLSWLKARVREQHPDAVLSIHDGHLHAEFPGYYAAPALGGAREAGLSNPVAQH